MGELGAVWAAACRPHAQAIDTASTLRVNDVFIQIIFKKSKASLAAHPTGLRRARSAKWAEFF
jgi:hypothetical protein